jgi:hypothetical protein
VRQNAVLTYSLIPWVGHAVCLWAYAQVRFAASLYVLFSVLMAQLVGLAVLVTAAAVSVQLIEL